MISKSHKCRTCFKGTKGLQCLTKLAIKDNKEPGKSYADLLKEVLKEDVLHDILPSSICGCCSRKLKAAYVFIQQAREVNKQFKSRLKEYNGELQIATEYLEVKMEAIGKYDMEEEEELIELKTEDDKTIKSENSLESNCPKDKLCDNEDVLKLCQQDILKSNINNKDNSVSSLTTKSRKESKKPLRKRKLKTLAKIKLINPIHPTKTKDIETNNKQQKDIISISVKCQDCDKMFENSRNLERHRRGAHVPEELKIQCLQCESKFARQHNMLAHMRLFHKIENLDQLEIPNTKTKSCTNTDSNNKDISTPQKLSVSKKRFLCTLCGLTFNSQYCLNIHFRRHTGEKPYKCDFCERAYIRLCDVQVHRRSHTGEKPYKCNYCEKAFSRANKLKIHIRSHTNERPYKCSQCEKAFKQSKHLNEHMRTHTGERPYRCDVCQSTFTQSNSLRSHQIKQKHLVGINVKNDLLENITKTSERDT